MIRGIDDCDLVNCLWYSCNKAIRSQLYLRNLHLEILSFKKVSQAAEIIQLVLSMENNQASAYRAEGLLMPQNKNIDGSNKWENWQDDKAKPKNAHPDSVSSNSAQLKRKSLLNKKGAAGK
jgi:hypothetical protein